MTEVFLKAMVIALALSLIGVPTYAQPPDYPHTFAQGVQCENCHYLCEVDLLNPDWIHDPPLDIDDTPFNNMCRSCHDGITATYVNTHSSLATSNKYGIWAMECRTCHWPHSLVQFRTYGSECYLFSGTSTSVTQTTLTMTGAGWVTDEYKGLIVIPNVNNDYYNYEIAGNTTDTLTVSGAIDLSQVSPGDTFAIVYGKLIKGTISTPYSGDKSVRFFNRTGTDSFADGDDIYTGICEVCHTDTTYHTNTGDGTTHFDGQDCTSACHRHEAGFAHSGAQGTGCDSCHGHDGGSGTATSHSTHTENDADDLMGPNVTCDVCHDTNMFPNFADGATTLAETTVCDNCHSPGGTYDGVDDPVVGAKNMWVNGVYSGSALMAGKEKWCATCHDEVPSVIQSVSAPNVVGDEDANSIYGIGWGYYKTGHGLPNGTYPASQAPAANKECSDCHNYTTSHIDGDPRTYSKATDNYQEGYRLKDVGGGLPMDIPRLDWSMVVSDFALCFECHASDPYLVETNYTTNFRSDTNVFNGHSPVNSHWYHLLGAGSHKDKWDSDWDGIQADSYMSCPACHNVHGSPSPRMIRHGELISTPGTTDKVPSLDFQYTPNTYPTLAESTGGMPRFIAGGSGTVAKNGVCVMCHNELFVYTRTPNDIYPPEIKAVYGEVGSTMLTVSFSKGVYSDTGAAGDLTSGDFTLTDTDNGRTIIVVTHNAGADTATLTTSSPLDSSEDVGTDMLAAASTASIYDASDNPMGTTPVTISGDADPPAISNLNPANGATDVAINSDLTFTLSDSGIGTDWTTFSIQLSGNQGYDKIYTDTETAVVSRTGAPAGYNVTMQPDAFFGSNETVTVTVNVDDLAGNSLASPACSFTAAGGAIWEMPDAVYDSELFGSPGNLIDDSFITGNTVAGGGAHYVTYKLDNGGDLYTVTDVRLYGGPTYTKTWRVYISLDGLTFTELTNNWSVGGASQWYVYSFPASETARYIKILYLGATIPADLAFEFQFKGTPVVNNNNVPALSWTGEANYTSDGVHPDSAASGSNFEFRVSYTDVDNDAPALIQVWVDGDDSGTYEGGEKYGMTEADVGDTDYTDGKLYTGTLSLLYTGDGTLNYRFAATDGTDPATGTPTADSEVIVINN